MEIRAMKEAPLYAYYTNCENIEIFRKDFDTVEVGDTFKAKGWDSDVTPSDRKYITVTCIYRDKKEVLLREHTKTEYNGNSYDADETLALIWIELKTEEQK